MKRLLWKEWQERRVWLLLCAVAIIIIGGLGLEQSPFEFNWNFSAWVSVTIILAVLAGLSGYGSELTGARAVFLYTRALGWQQVLLAKVLVGLAVMFGASLIAALVMRLLAPAPYVPFMTPMAPAARCCAASLFLGVVLPDRSGLLHRAARPGGRHPHPAHDGCDHVTRWLSVAFVTHRECAVADGFICLWHHAAVHGDPPCPFRCEAVAAAAPRRFGVVLCSVVAAGIVVGLLPPFQRCENKLVAGQHYDQFQINPSGTLACVQHYRLSKGKMRYDRMYLLSLVDRRVLPFVAEDNVMIHWISNECIIIFARPHRILLWLKHGQIHSHEFADLRDVDMWQFIPSPNGRKVLFDCRSGLKVFDMTTVQMRDIVDAQTGKRRKYSPIPGIGFAPCWWQSSDVVGYINPANGKRVLVKLSEP